MLKSWNFQRIISTSHIVFTQPGISLNLKKAIAEMLRVTRHHGFVMFDIQNRNNKEIENLYKKHLNEGKGIGRYQRYAKNIVKIILRRGFPDWNFVVYQTPTYPQVLYKHLSECNYPNTFQVFIRTKDDSIEAKDNPSFFEEYDRLVFVVKKAC